MAAPLLIIATALSLLSATVAAQDRAHGLANESPMAVSPEAYAFFHPKATAAAMQPSASTMPLAATVKSTPAHQSESAGTGDRGIGAGGIAGICLSFLLACVVGMGAYYVIKKRRANLSRAEQPPPAAADV